MGLASLRFLQDIPGDFAWDPVVEARFLTFSDAVLAKQDDGVYPCTGLLPRHVLHKDKDDCERFMLGRLEKSQPVLQDIPGDFVWDPVVEARCLIFYDVVAKKDDGVYTCPRCTGLLPRHVLHKDKDDCERFMLGRLELPRHVLRHLDPASSPDSLTTLARAVSDDSAGNQTPTSSFSSTSDAAAAMTRLSSFPQNAALFCKREKTTLVIESGTVAKGTRAWLSLTGLPTMAPDVWMDDEALMFALVATGRTWVDAELSYADSGTQLYIVHTLLFSWTRLRSPSIDLLRTVRAYSKDWFAAKFQDMGASYNRVDPTSFRLIVLPLNKASIHWSAAYVCNLGTCIARLLGTQEPAGEPCIVLLDSAMNRREHEPKYGVNTAAIHNFILAFVEAWYLKFSGSAVTISETDLPVIQPASPQQSDLVSCGGFVIKNTQQMIQALPQMERWTGENVHRQVSAAIAPNSYTQDDVRKLRAILLEKLGGGARPSRKRKGA